jgi:hypothetical protein
MNNHQRGSSSRRSERKLHDDSSDSKPPSRPGRRRQRQAFAAVHLPPENDPDNGNDNDNDRHTSSPATFSRSSTNNTRGPRVAKLDQDEPFDGRPAAPPNRNVYPTQEQAPSPQQSTFLNGNALCNDTTLHHRNTLLPEDVDVDNIVHASSVRIHQHLPELEETTHALDVNNVNADADDASSSRVTTGQTTTSTSSMELLVSKLYALHGPGPPMPTQMQMQQVPLYPAVATWTGSQQQQQQQQQPPVRLLSCNYRGNSTTSDLSSGSGAWWMTTSDRSDLIPDDDDDDNNNANTDDTSENDEQVGVYPKEEYRLSKDQHVKQAAQQPSDAYYKQKQAAATSHPCSPEHHHEPFYSTKRDATTTATTAATDTPNLYSYTRDDASQAEESIQSVIPPPPAALQQGPRYSTPGAFRMSTMGARPVIMDENSTVTSSIRSMPPQPPRDPSDDYVIEARLVEDGLTLASTTNGAEDDDDDHDDDHDHDADDCSLEELPSDEPLPPSPCEAAQYTVSMGGTTITTLGTTRTPIVEAEPIDEQHALRAFFSNKKVQFVLCVLILVFLVLAVGTTYGVTGFVGDYADPTDPPQANPDYSETVAPTFDATLEGDLDLRYFVHNTLPKGTKEALEKYDSAQSKALRWLRHNNTHLLSYSTEQRLQRFSLATFFYATGGERKWRSSTGWLTDADECQWFTTATATTTVCKDGMYHTLSLGTNGLRGTVPPELEFLTSLSLLEVPGNILTGSIPSNVGMMTNLRELRFCKWWADGGVYCNQCLYYVRHIWWLTILAL